MSDDRFSQYGRLAPAGKADLAFVQHMIHHLSDNGTMAVLVPHGVLFREGAEGHIRQFLIEEKNYLDAVIGLPANIFYGTGIPTCILVFKKCREQPSNILFIDASKEYGNAVNQNYLRPEDIDRIIATYRQRVAVEKYSYVAKMDEVSENQFNLNIPRYVRSTKNEEIINLKYIAKSLSDYEEKINGIEKIINEFCSELKLPEPNGNNLYYLHQYKKGVIQQLLNQEIRFKNDFGNEFEEWEEKKLIDIAVHITKKNKSNDVTFVLTNSATKGIVSQQDFFDKDIANQNNLFGYYIVEKDDFVYNPRISNNAPVGPVKRNHFGLGVMSPLYTVFRFKDNDLRFFEYYFETTNWHQYLQSVANYGARHDRMNITNSNFFKMLIPVPSQPEQKKIADFLAAIDYKIVCISQGL
jgi:type I restriction enzyme M protein